jgi:UDPglucose 6-dehydrogenase
MSTPVIGFAGMTHLGLNSAVATAARGFPVLGYDADDAVITRLGRRDLPIVEPGLDDLVSSNSDRLSFTTNATDLSRCDVVYIAADVPTDDSAKSDLSPIHTLIDQVAANLRDDAVMVVLCQVPPGFTRSISAVPPERLVYQVETLIFGRAVDRALNPERFIIGLADPAQGLPAVLQQLLSAFDCPILPMRYESAELAKISINFCLVASVTVANTLAELSEAIGADWAEIAPALKLDKRIGPYAYLTPGLGISGGNLERDLRTVLDLAAPRGTHVGMVDAWISNSHWRKDWLWRTLETAVLRDRPDARVAVLGLAYKEDTHSTKNSPALMLLDHLKGRQVMVHDPVVPASVVPWASGAATPLKAAEGVDVVVVATPWAEYRTLDTCELARVMRGQVIIDPYRLITNAEENGLEHHCLGRPAMTGNRSF